MIKIGIVGALSPLGQEMLTLLAGDCEVVWAVDEHYEADDPQKNQFTDFETALLYARPDIVLDFAAYGSLRQRIEAYRICSIPAIVQGVLPKEEIAALEKKTWDGVCAPVILEPDFSTVITQEVKNLLCQTHHLMNSVQSIRVDIRHNSDIELVRSSWLHWAETLNSIIGDYAESPTGDKTKFSLGCVNVNCHYAPELPQDEEVINIELIFDDAKGSLISNIVCPLLPTRVDGVLLLLEWYIAQREINQSLVMGEISTDMLALLI